MKSLVVITLASALLVGQSESIKLSLTYEDCFRFFGEESLESNDMKGCMQIDYPDLGTSDVLAFSDGNFVNDVFTGEGTLGPLGNLKVRVKSLDDNLWVSFTNLETGATQSVKGTYGETMDIRESALSFDSMLMTVDDFKNAVNFDTLHKFGSSDVVRAIAKQERQVNQPSCADLINARFWCFFRVRPNKASACATANARRYCPKTCEVCSDSTTPAVPTPSDTTPTGSTSTDSTPTDSTPTDSTPTDTTQTDTTSVVTSSTDGVTVPNTTCPPTYMPVTTQCIPPNSGFF